MECNDTPFVFCTVSTPACVHARHVYYLLDLNFPARVARWRQIVSLALSLSLVSLGAGQPAGCSHGEH